MAQDFATALQDVHLRLAVVDGEVRFICAEPAVKPLSKKDTEKVAPHLLFPLCMHRFSSSQLQVTGEAS